MNVLCSRRRRDVVGPARLPSLPLRRVLRLVPRGPRHRADGPEVREGFHEALVAQLHDVKHKAFGEPLVFPVHQEESAGCMARPLISRMPVDFLHLLLSVSLDNSVASRPLATRALHIRSRQASALPGVMHPATSCTTASVLCLHSKPHSGQWAAIPSRNLPKHGDTLRVTLRPSNPSVFSNIRSRF